MTIERDISHLTIVNTNKVKPAEHLITFKQNRAIKAAHKIRCLHFDKPI